MGELSCRRAELMIEALLDDRLDEPGRRALDEHLGRCSACRGYRSGAVYAVEALGDQALQRPSEQVVERMWRELDRRLDKEQALGVDRGVVRARALPWRAVAAASVALAAALAAFAVGFLWAWSPPGDETVARGEDVARGATASEVEASEPAKQARAEEVPAASLLLADGTAEVRRAGAPIARPGDGRLRDGDVVQTSDDAVAVLRRGDAVRLALGPGSALEVARVVEGAVEVALSSGWLVGRVEPGETPIEVTVRTPAGEVLVLGTIFAVEVADVGTVTVRVVRGEIAFDRDGDLGRTTVAAGREAFFPEGRSDETTPQVAARDVALLEGRITTPVAAVASAGVEELFERAEAARRRGQHEQAATLYRRIAASDRGAAGGTALISLGQLSLGPLGQPDQARRAFSSYLASGRRSLRQEALVGLLRSQRALGQTSAARATARRYVDEYPSGRYRAVADDLLR
jgi:hypothetical protein